MTVDTSQIVNKYLDKAHIFGGLESLLKLQGRKYEE